jgi:septal ring factor EnvC (AmiA/AmiB activator)
MPLRCVLLAAALALVGAASAQDKAFRQAPAKGARSAVLTPAQLRDCTAQKDRLHKQTDTALAVKAQIASEKAEIDRLGTILAEETASLDRTSTEAVDAYNAKVERREKLIDSYQAKVTSYNTQAEEVKATKTAYESACEGRRYDDRDLSDLQRKK